MVNMLQSRSFTPNEYWRIWIWRHDPNCVHAMVIISKLGLPLHSLLCCLLLAWKPSSSRMALVLVSDRSMGAKDIIIGVEVFNLIFSWAGNFSLKTWMMCVGHLKSSPLHKKFMKKNLWQARKWTHVFMLSFLI